MNLALRMILALTLATGVAAAQEATAAKEKTTTTTAVVTQTSPITSSAVTRSSDEIHHEFGALLRELPPDLASILVLDPTLLSNEAFLAGYPALARYTAEHPEVRRNPRFYLDEFQPRPDRGVLDDVLQGLMIAFVMSLMLFSLSWLIRTLIEQQRWNRLSRTQSEVHNKILDRFGSSEELMQYIKTPAGTKFLESAPISLHADQPGPNAPMSRILWSIQLGVVVVAGSIGLLFVSNRFAPDSARGMFAMGVIALSIGVGFIGSAGVSLLVSRRLGLLQTTPTDSEGLVR